MKKIIFILLVIMLLSACSNDAVTRKAVTFMIYMAADNSLSEFAVLDIDEMERADFSPVEMNVIVQADLGEYAADPDCYRWEIAPDGLYDYQISSPVVDNLGEIDSGDWQSLVDFYNWGTANYPADDYILAVWSHGNNWYSLPANPNKFCPDNVSGSYVNISSGELKQAFDKLNVNPHLVILDACHMQSLEVISEIYTNCSYVCGSMDIIPTSGFPYDKIISAVNTSGLSSIQNIPSLYVASYQPGGSQNLTGSINQEVCASMVDCETFADIILPQVAALATYIEEENHLIYSELNLSRQMCLQFNDYQIDIDMMQFIQYLNENSADSTLTGICDELISSAGIINDFYNYPAADIGSISLSYPQNEDQTTWQNIQLYYQNLQFDKLTNWYASISTTLPEAGDNLIFP